MNSRTTRPLEVRLLPAVGQFYDTGMDAVGRVHQSVVSEKVSQHRAAALFEIEPAVGQDGVDLPANLVLMGDNQNARHLGIGLPMQDEIACVVRLRFGPGWEQTVNRVFDCGFMSAAYAVGLSELLEDGLRCGRGRWLLGQLRFRQSGRRSEFHLARRALKIRTEQADDGRDVMTVNKLCRS